MKPYANFVIAFAHERLSPIAGTALSDDDLSEIVQETRIDLSVWLRYGLGMETKSGKKANRKIVIG